MSVAISGVAITVGSAPIFEISKGAVVPMRAEKNTTNTSERLIIITLSNSKDGGNMMLRKIITNARNTPIMSETRVSFRSTLNMFLKAIVLVASPCIISVAL